jgi:hypothetical protein
MSEERIGDWIQTYTGKQFWPLDPREDEVSILDIAHALANMCRFGGHCNRFYSVGEHSLHASHQVPKDLALHALMHDATEAYVADIPSPIKRLLPDYKTMEARVWAAIAAKFGLAAEEPEAVRIADKRMLLTERRALFDVLIPWGEGKSGIYAGLEPYPNVKIIGAPPAIVANAFMQRFHNLTGGKYANEQSRVLTIRDDARIIIPN